jgi:hypothetical protein
MRKVIAQIDKESPHFDFASQTELLEKFFGTPLDKCHRRIQEQEMERINSWKVALKLLKNVEKKLEVNFF